MQDKENNQKKQNLNDNYYANQIFSHEIEQFIKCYKANKNYSKFSIKQNPKRGRPKKIINEINSPKKNQNLQKEKENLSNSGTLDLTDETEVSEKKHDKLNLIVDMIVNHNIKRKRGRPRKNKYEEPKKKTLKKMFINNKRERDSKKNNTSVNKNNKNEIYVTPELKKLLALEKEYGLSKLINCLRKPDFDKNNNILEKNMNKIINKINLQKVLVLLLQIQTMSPSDKKKILKNSQNLSKNEKKEKIIDLKEDNIKIEILKNDICICENSKKIHRKIIKNEQTKNNKENNYIKKIKMGKNKSSLKNTNFNEAYNFNKNSETEIIHCIKLNNIKEGTNEITMDLKII